MKSKGAPTGHIYGRSLTRLKCATFRDDRLVGEYIKSGHYEDFANCIFAGPWIRQSLDGQSLDRQSKLSLNDCFSAIFRYNSATLGGRRWIWFT